MGTIKQSCCELVFRSFASTGCWQQVLFHHICSGPAKKVRHYSHLQSLLLNSQGGLGCCYLDFKIMVLRTRGPGCSALCKESASMFGEGILTLCTYSSLPLDPTLQIFLHALKQRCKCMVQFKWFPLDSCVKTWTCFCVLWTLLLQPIQEGFPFHESSSIIKMNHSTMLSSP